MDSAIVKHSPILWIEGRWPGSQDFVSLLRIKGFLIETTSTGKQAIEMADGNQYDLLIVNAASMRTSGARIVKRVNERYPDLADHFDLRTRSGSQTGLRNYVGYVLVLDFTTRKLVNRIMKLLPGDEKQMIHQGPIVVDPRPEPG